MNTFILIVILLVNDAPEIKTVSEHNTLLSCHANKAQYNENDFIHYKCIKK